MKFANSQIEVLYSFWGADKVCPVFVWGLAIFLHTQNSSVHHHLVVYDITGKSIHFRSWSTLTPDQDILQTPLLVFTKRPPAVYHKSNLQSYKHTYLKIPDYSLLVLLGLLELAIKRVNILYWQQTTFCSTTNLWHEEIGKQQWTVQDKWAGCRSRWCV